MSAEDPPVYTPVSTTDQDTKEENPPSYFNVVKQLKAAKQDAKNPVDLTQKTITILCTSVFFTIFLVISSIIPIAMLIVGIISQDKCVYQPKIPLWLIVSGITGILLAVVRFISNIVAGIRFRKHGKAKESTLLGCFINIASLFAIVWFILGNVWVYSIVKTVQYDQQYYPHQYCDKFCYLFSFWSITASWIMLGLGCACCCGIICIGVGVSAFLCAGK